MAAQPNSIPAVGRPNDIVDIRAGMLFPFPFRIFGAVFILTGLLMTAIEPVPSVLLMLVGLGVVTAYEGTEIDTSRNTFREYYSFLMIRNGARKSFVGIDRVFICASSMNEQIPMATFWWSRKSDRVEYNAYVQFSDGTRVFLFSNERKHVVIERLNRIGSLLHVRVSDQTPPDNA
jgi:hypothetical protein